MSYKFTLGQITWGNPAPVANVTCTLRHRIAPTDTTHPLWVVDSANVVIDPTGVPQSLHEVAGLVDGQAYEFEVIPNCGSIGKVRIIVIPTPGGAIIITLSNQNATAPINQLRIDGTTQLGGPLAAGTDVDLNITAEVDGNPNLIEILLPNSETGKIFGYAIKLVDSPSVEEGYFEYNGVYTSITSILLQHSFLLVIRNADEHLDVANYSVLEGPITGNCELGNMTLQRTQLGMQDATANGDKVRVTMHLVGSNGQTADVDVDMDAGEETITGIAADLGGAPCASVAITITSVVVIP